MQDDQVLKIDLFIKNKLIKTYSFTQDTIEIGRIPTADIFIDNSSISREHTRIERSIGGPYIIRDINSTNGTFLNDRKISEAAIKDNDTVSLGKFTLKLRFEGKNKPLKKKKVSPKDFDGTTVLSASQLEKLHSSVLETEVNDPDSDPDLPRSDVPTSLLAKNKDLPVTQVLFWACMIILMVVIIGLILA
jgi:pSer/pThr/pTyr-binding forkhead associated (FHA) protein